MRAPQEFVSQTSGKFVSITLENRANVAVVIAYSKRHGLEILA